MIPQTLPKQALPFFGPDPSGDWGGLPWANAVRRSEGFAGLWGGAAVCFGLRGVLFSSDFDIDIDGPGGNKATDPYYESQTSLRTAGGVSCDSRHFPGVVIPPPLKALGVRLGDFCLVAYNGRVRPAQVYDIGPTRKIGEGSIYLGRQLGIVRPDETDRHAATAGNDATDVCTLIFPGSGPGHAIAPDLIADAAMDCWRRLTGRAAALAATT